MPEPEEEEISEDREVEEEKMLWQAMAMSLEQADEEEAAGGLLSLVTD